jgi:Cu-Zn family superoxide dismutase
MTKYLAALLIVVAIGIAAGLVGQEKGVPTTAPQKAVAALHPTEGNKVTGIVFFAQKNGYVEITGEVSGLTPGLHGFHIHEYGDFSAKDGKSAGGHFNPTNMPHGGPDDAMRHVGDLGNLQADAGGKATVKIHDKVIKLNGPHSIIGRGLVVHAKADDLKTQPTGDAGDRVAVGVIGVANPSPKK